MSYLSTKAVWWRCCGICSQKTVVVSLWNNMAMNEGATLSNTVNDSPVLMVKSLRASDFQGICICLFLASAISDQVYWLDSLLFKVEHWYLVGANTVVASNMFFSKVLQFLLYARGVLINHLKQHGCHQPGYSWSYCPSQLVSAVLNVLVHVLLRIAVSFCSRCGLLCFRINWKCPVEDIGRCWSE